MATARARKSASTKKTARKTAKKAAKKTTAKTAKKAAKKSASASARPAAKSGHASKKTANTKAAARKAATKKVTKGVAKKAPRKAAKASPAKKAPAKTAKKAAKKMRSTTGPTSAASRPKAGKPRKTATKAGGITPKQALANTRALLEAKKQHDRQTPPWQAFPAHGGAAVPPAGPQSPEAAAKANATHLAEARVDGIHGSISTHDRKNQGKRDSRDSGES